MISKEAIKLTKNDGIFADNEFAIMSEIETKECITQRELSKKLGVSVSTVNILVNKMVREGLIKMTQVSQKQVFYILTPKGMMEKAKKTVSYLKIHYKAIDQTKEKIKAVLAELNQKYDAIFVFISNDEMGEVIGMAIEEFELSHLNLKIEVSRQMRKFDTKYFVSPVLLYMDVDEKTVIEFNKLEGLIVVNLAEKI